MGGLGQLGSHWRVRASEHGSRERFSMPFARSPRCAQRDRQMHRLRPNKLSMRLAWIPKCSVMNPERKREGMNSIPVRVPTPEGLLP